MNEQELKLTKVKKSCKIVKVISLIITIIGTIATVLSLGTSIFFLTSGGKYDDALQTAVNEGHLTFSVSNGFITVTESDMSLVSNIDSSIPALDKELENASISFAFGLYLLIIFFTCAATIIPCFLFYSVFKLMSKEESPFSDKVVRRILISFIIISVIVLITLGLGFGLLSCFLTWAIYTIMDYGRVLQTQSDETL